MKKVIMALISALLISGCVDTAQWTEEVMLHDGTIIQVERTVRANSSGFSNSRRGGDIYTELTFQPLNVHWKSDLPRELISFEIFNKIPYLVLYNGDRDFCKKNKKGAYKAAFLKYQNSVWVEISQSDFPTDKALKNLHMRYFASTKERDAMGLVTWREKAIRDGFNTEKPQTVDDWYINPNRMCGYA